MSGLLAHECIERDVFVYSQPKAAIKDFRVKSTLDNSYKDGAFDLAVELRNRGDKEARLSISYELIDKANGKTVAKGEEEQTVEDGKENTVSFGKKIPGIKTWTSEKPHLYKLVMTVKENGTVTEVVPFNVGFRRIEIKP